MILRRLIIGMTLFAASVGLAGAETLPLPKVDYSGTRVVEAAKGSFKAKVHASGGKERSEMDMGGMNMVTIVRPDKKLAWILMPMQQMYQEIDISQSQAQSAGAPPTDMEASKIGSDTIDGKATTKYKLINQDQRLAGTVWVTDEGIPLKMELLAKESGEKASVTMTLQNLQIGKQDPALFELPAGYSKMPAMPGMGGMGMMPGH